MKQDLIKMTAILTTDTSEKSNSMHGGSLVKGVEEVSGEPFEIMEKVKEDLEKVNEILRSGTYEDEVVEDSEKAGGRPYRKDEEWVLLSDCEIEEAKMMAAFETQEALLKDIRGSRQSQKGVDRDHKEYFLDAHVTSGAKVQESVAQEKFTEIVLRKGGKKIVPTVLKDNKTHVTEVKKPIRRKGPHGQSNEYNVSTSKTGSVSERTEKTQRDDGLLHAPSNEKKSPVSPVVEETPIGSIKDKVKALQKKVEEEQKGRKQTGSKPSHGSSGKKSSPVIKDQKTPTSKKTQAPTKTPKNESERLEETLSVKELMKAFQTGQDPSKGKSGLFEHKASSGLKHTKTVQINETLSRQSPSQTSSLGQKVSLETKKCVDPEKMKEFKISMEIGHSQDLSSSVRPKPEGSVQCQELKMLTVQDEVTSALQSVEPSAQTNLATTKPQDLSKENESLTQLHSGLDMLNESSDSHKIERTVVSPCASVGENEVHMSSEDSDKHEGMAETLDTSPESLSSSPKQPSQCIDGKLSKVETVTAKNETSTLSNDSSTGAKTADDQASTTNLGYVSVKNALDYCIKSESVSASQSKTVKFVDKKFSVDEDILLTSSKPTKSRKLMKRGSETIDSFLSDEEPSDGQQLSTSTDYLATRADTQGYSGLVLPLRHQDSETISPVADDSITISHKDSLEGSPLMEDNSSHNSPDSIEPSPTKDSPCCDSLESSPIEQKNFLTLPSVEQPSVTAGQQTSSKTPLPSEKLHRLPRDQEDSVDGDSCEQTSQLKSSGKSSFPPDTPSFEEVSYELNLKTQDPMVHSMFLFPSVIPEDAEGDVLKCIMTQRKFNPEEEMFKMAAKIKTFDEMEQDEKDRKGYSKEIFSQTMNESERGNESIILIGPEFKVETDSVDGLGPTETKQWSEVAQSNEPNIKVQPPSPFPAGVHEIPQTSEDMAHTAASTDESAMEGPPSVSETHTAKDHQFALQNETQTLNIKVLEQTNKQLLSKEGMVNIENLELKEESQKMSWESKYDDKGGKQKDLSDYQEAYRKSPSPLESHITYNVEGDNIRPTGISDTGLSRDSLRAETDTLSSIMAQARDTFKPEICIYDDIEEDELDEELPKTKSRGVTAKTMADNWNDLREDDDAFAARVKEEEQKILGLAVDRQSQAATPDTTPGRTPTEEGTPTSEQNPFLFQEGKLFEMTRSGAIDMTKRGYEEEGFAYFQIGEQPIEEALIEDAMEEPGAEQEIAINLTLQNKPEDVKEYLEEATDICLHSTPENDQSGIASKSNVPQPTIPINLAVSVSPQTSKNNIAKEAVEIKTDKLPEESLSGTDLGTTDTIITNVQTAVSTVTRSVYSQQDQESSDSSPEDEHSVIELPKAPEKRSQTSKMISKSKTKPDSKGNTASAQKKTSFSKEEEKPKSRIPIKAISNKSETEHDLSVKSPKEKNTKLPVKPETRRKSETDTGPSVSSRVTRPIKAKSYCESDSTKKPAKKDQGHPTGTELPNKYKTLPSKLPVRGKPGQPTQTTTTSKKEQPSERCKKPTDFFEEISDEAAKLVERLAQAEKEKEEAAAISDDESSTIDVSVIESEPFPDMQMPLPEDPLVIRPRWDDPVETQMERIPADKAQVQSQADPQDELDRKEGRLAVMADHLGFSWTELARELEFDEEQVNQIRVKNPNSLQDQSHALIRLWTKREGTNATESILISKLKKINRMDIVHLIETKIIQSIQDHSSHTYAEIEQSISLDNSEGFSALHEDIDSPRPVRHTELTSKMPKYGLQPPLVSAEDLSSSVSSLNDTQKEKPLLQIDKTEEVAAGPTLSGFEMIGLRQQFPGTVKKVSPFFTLYKTTPWRLQSSKYGPVNKEQAVSRQISKIPSQQLNATYDEALQELGAAGGQSEPIPVSKYICEIITPTELPRDCKQKQKEIIMTDFEETLLESEHSEADFSEIAVELNQGPVDYASNYASSTSFPFFQPSNQTASDNVKLAQTLSETENLHCETEIPIPEAKAKSMCELPSNQRPNEEYMKQHVEEISAKFYRALFGEDYVEAKTLGKDVNIVTESFEPSEYERFTVDKLDAAEALNIDQVTFELSSEVNKKSAIPPLEANISKKDLQVVKTVCSSPPKQLLTRHEESPESVTSQTQCNDSMPDNQFVSEPEKEEMISKPGESPPPVINKEIKMIADDGDGSNMLRIQEDHQRINVAKQDLVLQHKQSLEARYDSPTSEIGQQEFKTRALQDIASEKDIRLKNQSRERKNKNIRVSEEDSSQVQNQSTSATILEQNAIGSSLTSEVSEYEKPVSALSTDDSDLVAGGICPMEIALAPTSFETSHSTDGSLMDVDLKKAKPRPVQSDSLESDNEFFDCQQTFSDVPEPELRSEDIFGPETLYHVEEFPSLPNTPAYDYLLVTSKITEKSEVDSQDSPCPVSWGSEEIDLPLVLEPEDECVDEHEEEVAYPYGYADEHSYAEELPPRQGGQYDEDDDSLGREIAAELDLLSDSSEEEVLTTRVVRRRVIIQGDELPDISPYKVTEEQYTDEHGNIVTKKITRKIIRKYVSADGTEREEVMQEGTQQEAITVDEADCFSKVLKRTVVKSAGDQTEVTFSEAAPVGKVTASGYEGENADGRKVSKVIKTMMVQGERMEKQIGDPSLSADLPSAKEDFEKALGYAGGFDKVVLPHLVEKEIMKEDGSMIRRTRMRKTRTQKKTVVRDGQSRHIHLERLEDTPESLQPDDLQQHLHQLLQRYCTPEVEEDEEEAEEVKEKDEKQDTND
ncbi:ankyrin-2b isoform X1 [Tachysurus ichikawai]